MPDEDLFLEGFDPTDARSDENTPSGRVRGKRAGLLQGHVGGGDRELGAPVAAPYLLRVVEVRSGVEVVDPTLTVRCRPTEAVPERVGTDAARGDNAQSGYGDPTSGH